MFVISEIFHLLLDIIKIIFAAVWNAVTFWNRKDRKDWAYQYVPSHVSDNSMLGILSLLSWKGLDKDTIEEHLKKNETGWDFYQKHHMDNTYIEHQADMKDVLLYGNHSADYNSCEVIAVYNALLSLQDQDNILSFPKLLSIFEKKGICKKGSFGTSPKAILKFFQNKNYKTQMLVGKKICKEALDKLQDEYQTFILTAYNDKKNIGAQIHTVSISKEICNLFPNNETSEMEIEWNNTEENKNIKFELHNANSNKIYNSLYEAIIDFRRGNAKAICIIGIKKSKLKIIL